MENKRLFILSPTNSGSSFLTKSLLMCQRTLCIPGTYSSEACLLPLAKKWGVAGAQKSRKGRIGAHFDIEIMRDIVEAAWRSHECWEPENKVLVEKSPGYDIFNAQKMDKLFPNPQFIILMRNPVAYTEGMRRREENASLANAKKIIDFWKLCAYKQRENFEKLDFSVVLTYEIMCDFPDQIEGLIKDFVYPQLNDFSLKKEVRCGSITHKGHVPHKLKNFNDLQIATLDQETIDLVWEELKDDKEILEFFNYERDNIGGSS